MKSMWHSKWCNSHHKLHQQATNRHRREVFKCLITLQVSNADPTSVGWPRVFHYIWTYRNYTCQHGLSSKTRTASKGNIYARVSSRFPFLSLRHPNLAFLSGRLNWPCPVTWQVTLLSRSSLVLRSFFCGDLIGITSWAPDVVNLVCPKASKPCDVLKISLRHKKYGCEQQLGIATSYKMVPRTKGPTEHLKVSLVVLWTLVGSNEPFKNFSSSTMKMVIL